MHSHLHIEGQLPVRHDEILDVLGKRLARYGLTLHPGKTRFIDFRFKRPDGAAIRLLAL
jgi:hypothetical protein